LNFNLNINDDDYNLSDYFIIYEKFGQRPNKLIVHDSFLGSAFEKIITTSNTNRVTELLPTEDSYIVNEKVLLEINEDIWCSYFIINKDSDNFIINDICFFYKKDENLIYINKVVEDLSNSVVDYDKESINKFNTISISNGSLDIEPIYVDVDSLSVAGKYKSETIKMVNHLARKIKKTNKGLSIFYGDKGVGKTTMLKYLSSKVDRMSIYIPNNMIDITINNPEFKTFFKKFDKIFILIDDCEFLSNQFLKINQFSNNIIQLVDGFLSDSLNIHILLVFNGSKDEIDESILECNNLIDIIEFGKLNSHSANELSKKMGFNKKYKYDVKLSDVVHDKIVENEHKIGL
jgi:energy-coupling factor transporter ATP-binding protein EcfA2